MDMLVESNKAVSAARSKKTQQAHSNGAPQHNWQQVQSMQSAAHTPSVRPTLGARPVARAHSSPSSAGSLVAAAGAAAASAAAGGASVAGAALAASPAGAGAGSSAGASPGAGLLRRRRSLSRLCRLAFLSSASSPSSSACLLRARARTSATILHDMILHRNSWVLLYWGRHGPMNIWSCHHLD